MHNVNIIDNFQINFHITCKHFNFDNFAVLVRGSQDFSLGPQKLSAEGAEAVSPSPVDYGVWGAS